MRKWLWFPLLCSLAFAQGTYIGKGAYIGTNAQVYQGAPSGGSSPAYTGQNCTGGGTAGLSTSTCTATMTVSTGDEVMVFGTNGSATQTISSCTSATGTAAVTWTVVLDGSTAHDATHGETAGMCVGNVTSGGTVEPRVQWTNNGGDDSIVAAAYSGSSTHATDTGVVRVNATGSSATNGNTPGTITTTTNNDLLFGGIADVIGTTATISAGSTSVAFTKRVCTTAWGGQTCIEDGAQTTAGAGTTAAWTFNNTDANMSGIVALKP